MNGEKILRNRWFWIIFVILWLWIGGFIAIGVIEGQEKISFEKVIYSPHILIYYAITFTAGLLYWIFGYANLHEYNNKILWLTALLWILFIFFLVKIKTISKQWLLRILIILLLITILSVVGYSNIKILLN